jgi:signal transduction histidine kinase
MRLFPSRWTPKTLSGRLALGGIAWIAVWAVGLLLVFNVLLSSVLAHQVDAALRARAEAVAATVTVHDGRLVIAEGNDAALDAGTSIYLGRSVVEGNTLAPELAEHLLQRGDQTADRELLGPVRYLAQPIRSHGQQIGTIVVSSDIGDNGRTELIVGIASIIFIALTLIFTFFALRGTIGLAMRPVRVMGDQASTWSDQDLDRRFDPHAGPLELRELAVTLNALLERISATVRHERHFTAELSHELRTPLAHLHAEVDLLSASISDPRLGEPVTEGDLGGLMTSIRRLEGLVESALMPARAQQYGAPGLGLISDVLLDLPRPPSASAQLRITGDTSLTLAVESEIARRALLPVLENAWRYAVREVLIDVSAVDGTAHLVISDDGGRLAADQTEAIFQPGFRADRSDGYPGAGLGLALTRRIARSAGGDATAAVAGHRTEITLTFPCIASGPP